MSENKDDVTIQNDAHEVSPDTDAKPAQQDCTHDVLSGSVRYYYQGSVDSNSPVVIVNAYEEDGEKLLPELKRYIGFVLAVVPVSDWDMTLSPWPAKRVFKNGSDFGGGADAYAQTLSKEILPEIRNHTGISAGPCYIAGYSLAGMFALYSLYRTNVFSGAASVSGSLWFPGFAEYAMTNSFCRKPDRLYFSLGDRESSTRNETMKTVGEKTELLFQYYQKLQIECIYESNPGNHFQNPEDRLRKGIEWLLLG